MKFTPAQLEELKRRRPDLFADRPATPAPAPVSALALVKKPCSEEERLNKLEAAFLGELRNRGHAVGIQSITLKIADDTRYTPDFFTIESGQLVFHEVKGGRFWDDARVKLRVAARMFPFFRFRLVRRKKNGPWTEQMIPP